MQINRLHPPDYWTRTYRGRTLECLFFKSMTGILTYAQIWETQNPGYYKVNFTYFYICANLISYFQKLLDSLSPHFSFSYQTNHSRSLSLLQVLEEVLFLPNLQKDSRSFANPIWDKRREIHFKALYTV